MWSSASARMSVNQFERECHIWLGPMRRQFVATARAGEGPPATGAAQASSQASPVAMKAMVTPFICPLRSITGAQVIL